MSTYRSLLSLCLDYSRSETAFAIISLALMLLGAGFSLYATREPRYMFKRLAAALHFMTGTIHRSLAVTLHLMISTIHRNLVAALHLTIDSLLSFFSASCTMI